MEAENYTDVWKLYEKGINYNTEQHLYEDTERNYNFFHGNQWLGAKLGDVKPITLNILKVIVKHKLGIINSNQYQIVYNTNTYDVELNKILEELCKNLNRHANKVWELEQVDKKIKECLKDAAINDEGIGYFYFDTNTNQIKTEVVDKNNICYGNEKESNIQNQPYIIISFRRTLEEAKKEAINNGISEDIARLITADEARDEIEKDKKEDITPMCTVLLKLYKKNGTIHSIKATRNVVIQKETDHKIKLYPVAHINWEEVKNSARGCGEVRYNIANQIEINKTATRRAIAVKMGAFPKLVVNTKYIKNTSALDEVGTTIKINGEEVDDINKVVGYLRPSNMSGDAERLQNELQTSTKDLAGAGDVATGNVDPTQASGKAILAVQQANQQPINEQLDRFKTFLEDIARIWFDLWQTYEVNGMTIMVEGEDEQGNKTEEPYTIPYEVLNQLNVNVKIDITPQSPYDRYARELSIEQLLEKGLITFEEYIDLLDEGSVMQKFKLEEVIKKRKKQQAMLNKMEMQIKQQEFDLSNRLQEEQIRQQTLNNNLDNMEKNIQNQYQNFQNQLGG